MNAKLLMFLMKNDIRPLSPDDFPPPLSAPYLAIKTSLFDGKKMFLMYFLVLDMMASKL